MANSVKSPSWYCAALVSRRSQSAGGELELSRAGPVRILDEVSRALPSEVQSHSYAVALQTAWREGQGAGLYYRWTSGDSELTEEDLEAVERVRELPQGGESDQRTGLSETQIRSLPLPVRLKLCRGASRTLRSILVKDINPNVALSTCWAMNMARFLPSASWRLMSKPLVRALSTQRRTLLAGILA